MKNLFKILLIIALSWTAGAAQAQNTSRYLDKELASGWRSYSDTEQIGELPSSEWWKKFGDSTLDSLIEVGLQRNYNVAMATRRIQIAQNAVGSARASYYPDFSVGVGYNIARSSGLLAGSKGSASTESYFSGTVSMNWEIDVFGKVKSQVNAKKAAVKVSRVDRAGIMVSLAAQIASTYIDMRVAQAEISIANENAKSQKKALDIAQARFETGLASKLDVDQAKTVYYNTLASLPSLENQVHQDINSIAVLINEKPEAIESQLSTPKALPAYIQIVSTGIPADLLRRRPDIVEAEYEIDEYAAQLGIAKKDYLPDLSLSGSFGVAAHNIGDMFRGPAFEYSIAPTLSWTIFDGFARKYNVASARENMETAIDNYNLTVMTAYEETDNALASYFTNVHYIQILDDLLSASREYDRLSLDQYKNGLAAYINVADAQVSLLEYENTYIQAQGQALIALIDLYKALGGGWSE